MIITWHLRTFPQNNASEVESTAAVPGIHALSRGAPGNEKGMTMEQPWPVASGNWTVCYGKWPIDKLIFNSYVSLPEGSCCVKLIMYVIYLLAMIKGPEWSWKQGLVSDDLHNSRPNVDSVEYLRNRLGLPYSHQWAQAGHGVSPPGATWKVVYHQSGVLCICWRGTKPLGKWPMEDWLAWDFPLRRFTEHFFFSHKEIHSVLSRWSQWLLG